MITYQLEQNYDSLCNFQNILNQFTMTWYQNQLFSWHDKEQLPQPIILTVHQLVAVFHKFHLIS